LGYEDADFEDRSGMATLIRILGIDPGLRSTGFGVIEAEGAKLHYVASGTIKTESAASLALPARLKIIFDGVREVTARYAPHCASVEIVFVNVNPQSTLLLGQALPPDLPAPLDIFGAGALTEGDDRSLKTLRQRYNAWKKAGSRPTGAMPPSPYKGQD